MDLAVYSGYFQTFFDSQFPEAASQEVNIEGAEPAVLESIIKALYEKEVNCDSSQTDVPKCYSEDPVSVYLKEHGFVCYLSFLPPRTAGVMDIILCNEPMSPHWYAIVAICCSWSCSAAATNGHATLGATISLPICLRDFFLQILLTFENAPAIFALGDRLQIDCIVKTAEQFLISHLSYVNAVDNLLMWVCP